MLRKTPNFIFFPRRSNFELPRGSPRSRSFQSWQLSHTHLEDEKIIIFFFYPRAFSFSFFFFFFAQFLSDEYLTTKFTMLALNFVRRACVCTVFYFVSSGVNLVIFILFIFIWMIKSRRTRQLSKKLQRDCINGRQSQYVCAVTYIFSLLLLIFFSPSFWHFFPFFVQTRIHLCLWLESFQYGGHWSLARKRRGFDTPQSCLGLFAFDFRSNMDSSIRECLCILGRYQWDDRVPLDKRTRRRFRHETRSFSLPAKRYSSIHERRGRPPSLSHSISHHFFSNSFEQFAETRWGRLEFIVDQRARRNNDETNEN